MQTISDHSSADSAPDSYQVRNRFGLLIGGVYRRWRRQVELSFKELGLSDATRMPLLALYTHGQSMRQKDLAQALQLDSSSLVRVLSQLRSAQLVDWASEPGDRRTKCIALTPEGRRVAAQILERSLAIEKMILADLTAEELAITRSALQKISQRFDVMQDIDLRT